METVKRTVTSTECLISEYKLQVGFKFWFLPFAKTIYYFSLDFIHSLQYLLITYYTVFSNFIEGQT